MATKFSRNSSSLALALRPLSRMPMARSISCASSAALTSVAGTATLEMWLPGDSLRSTCASGGRNIISPRSDSDRRQRMWLLAGSNASSLLTVFSSRCSCSITAGTMRCALRVGCRPCGERMNSSSSKIVRSRASALLVAGCDSARWRPASVTEP